MQPESPTYLWDARRAAGLVHQFVSGRTFVEYTDDSMLRSAVERQFEIVGEALNRLRRVDPETAAQIPDLARIIAFRNSSFTATRPSTTTSSGTSQRQESASSSTHWTACSRRPRADKRSSVALGAQFARLDPRPVS
ncbi:DUF86 domain-containing protein [Brachybacterium sp.]|uniref:HepT-like ribonuclease domain-containing protein n=1 Tax=Brachybacterium sp. TaxID=1891286 RepID=UPI003461C9D0